MTGPGIYLGVLLLAIVLPRLADPEVRRALRRHRTRDQFVVDIAAFEDGGGHVQAIDRVAAVITKGTRTFWTQIWVPFLVLAVWVAVKPSRLWIACLLAVAVSISTEVREASKSEPTNSVGLAEAVTSQQRRLRTGALGIKAGLLLIAGAAGCLAITTSSSQEAVRAAALSLVSVLAFKYAHVVVLFAERRIRRHAAVEFGATPVTRQGVLLLRSFSTDDARVFHRLADSGPARPYLPGRRRFEELISGMCVRMGKTVTVGNPDEHLPLLGAARTYRDHDDWQESVIATAEASKAIIVFAGLTDSLAWEIGELRRRGLLFKTIVLIPPGDDLSTARYYEQLCIHLDLPDPALPPTLTGKLLGLRIAPDGSPIHYVAMRRTGTAFAATMSYFMWSLEGVTTAPDRFVVPADRAETLTPLHESLIAFEHNLPTVAKRRLVGASLLPHESLAARIWSVACLDRDTDEATRLVTLDSASDQPTLTEHDRILKHLANVKGGYNVPRTLLLDLLARRTTPREKRPWDGYTHFLPDSGWGNIPTPLSCSIDAFKIAEESGDPQDVLTAASVVLATAEATGEPTIVAGAQVLLGELLAVHDAATAKELFLRAGRLRDAPKIVVHVRVPVWDPESIVYRARRGLWSIAAESDDDPVAVALGEWLATHRPSTPEADPVRDRLW